MIVNKDLKQLIVGNKLQQQLNLPYVIGAEQFLESFHRLPVNRTSGIWFLGQGLSEFHKRQICQKLQLPLSDLPNKASMQLTHKHHPENVLITDPQQTASDRYQSELLIDDSCSDMSDHLSGQHIQAMILIEAARQMNIAVAEKFLISDKLRGRTAMVLHTLETDFRQYIFPLSVAIDYQIIRLRTCASGFFKAEVKLFFQQNRQDCVEIVMTFSVMDKHFLKQKEEQGIQEVFDSIDRTTNHPFPKAKGA